MPLFLDRHRLSGATLQQVADAHKLDVERQERYHVRYVTYWFDPDEGSVYCLAEGPDRDALSAVHAEAHGLIADTIIEVGDGPINAFLGEPPRHPVGEPYAESAIRVILFTDICDSTEQTHRLGDEGFMPLLRTHDQLVRDALARHGGREVKHTGDGIMASFTSVASAVQAAVDVQEAIGQRNAGADHELRVRIGITVGEPVTEHEDLFGAAVQLSARLCAAAAPGGVCVSNAVREMCAGKPLRFSAPRDVHPKGFAEPLSVFDVEL